MPENKRKKYINIDDANAWEKRESEIEEEMVLYPDDDDDDPYVDPDEDEEEYFGNDNCEEDGIYLSSQVRLLREHCTVLLKVIMGFVDIRHIDALKYGYLKERYDFLLAYSDAKLWTNLINSILEYIDKEIGFDEIKKFIPNKKTLEYLKRKEKSFNIGKAKLEKLVSKEKKLSDDTVKNKIVQDKLSQKD